MGIRFLGKIPLDPRIARSCDEGKSFFSQYPNSETAQAYLNVINGALEQLQNNQNMSEN